MLDDYAAVNIAVINHYSFYQLPVNLTYDSKMTNQFDA